jgi:hypothetical protein
MMIFSVTLVHESGMNFNILPLPSEAILTSANPRRGVTSCLALWIVRPPHTNLLLHENRRLSTYQR